MARRRTRRRTRRRNRRNNRSHGGPHRQRRSRRRSSRNQSGGRRKMNAYFKLMLNAKRKKLDSFRYKGRTYKKKMTKTGMAVYKKA